jgi:hypothetical protein
MIIYLSLKLKFELYWIFSKKHTNIISTRNTHMKQKKHLQSHSDQKNTQSPTQKNEYPNKTHI